MLGSIASLLLLGSLAEWREAFKPEGALSIRYRELREETHDRAGLDLSAELGVFPSFNDYWSFGFALRTSSDDPVQSPGTLALRTTKKDQSLGLARAFALFHSNPQRPFQLQVLGGKFKNPHINSVLWDPGIYPTGLFEEMRWSQKTWKARAFFGQWPGDEAREDLNEGRRFTRSWILVPGVETQWRIEETLVLGAYSSLWQWIKPTSSIAAEALEKGNRVQVSAPGEAQFENKFLAWESGVFYESRPIGILTKLSLSFAINPRADENDRAYFVTAEIGRPWRTNNFVFNAKYFYIEPDVQVATALSDATGFSNRDGGLLGLDYFWNDSLRLGGQLSYAIPVQNGLGQRNRKEARVGVEWRI